MENLLGLDQAALSDWNGNFTTVNNGDTLSGAPEWDPGIFHKMQVWSGVMSLTTIFLEQLNDEQH